MLGGLSRFAGADLEIDEAVFEAEWRTGDRNRAIAYLMRTFGMLREEVDAAVETYFRQCSVLVDARSLATMGATLANRGVNPLTGERGPVAGARGSSAERHDHLRHVRLRRGVALPDRASGQERRVRRRAGGPSRRARDRRLLAAARRARQQRSRHPRLRAA